MERHPGSTYPARASVPGVGTSIAETLRARRYRSADGRASSPVHLRDISALAALAASPRLTSFQLPGGHSAVGRLAGLVGGGEHLLGELLDGGRGGVLAAARLGRGGEPGGEALVHLDVLVRHARREAGAEH